jgi:hypothetical protein
MSRVFRSEVIAAADRAYENNAWLMENEGRDGDDAAKQYHNPPANGPRPNRKNEPIPATKRAREYHASLPNVSLLWRTLQYGRGDARET